MQAMRVIAATTATVNSLTLGLALYAGDNLTSGYALTGAAFAGWAYLYLKDGESPMPTYRDLAMRLRWEIKNEEGWVPGTPLPAHRELAHRFGTTRTTLRKALELLAEEGLLDIRHGSGTFIAGVHDPSRSALLENYLRGRISQGLDIGRAEQVAAGWSVSPSTVRRVIAKLAKEGILRRRINGTYEAAK